MENMTGSHCLEPQPILHDRHNGVVVFQKWHVFLAAKPIKQDVSFRQIISSRPGYPFVIRNSILTLMTP
jgi:hypothetical protein